MESQQRNPCSDQQLRHSLRAAERIDLEAALDDGLAPAFTCVLSKTRFASHLQYNKSMKTATLPPIRVAPDFRAELEGVLEQGESLSQFVEHAVRTTIAKRKNQAEFVRRGLAAIEATQRDGGGIPAATVIGKLEAKLAAAKRAKSQRGG